MWVVTVLRLAGLGSAEVRVLGFWGGMGGGVGCEVMCS